MPPMMGIGDCPVNVQRLKRDMFDNFFGMHIKDFNGDLPDKILAWHPLLKDAGDLSEIQRLSAVTNGPKLLSNEVIAWAKK